MDESCAHILDLTSDDGMYLFYEVYENVFRYVRLYFEDLEACSHGDSLYREYLNQLRVCLENVYGEVFKYALEDEKRCKDKFNFDSLVLSCLCEEYDVDIIIAAIQQGSTYNLFMLSHRPTFVRHPGNKGLKQRDHIEVCITNYDIIRNIVFVDECCKDGSSWSNFKAFVENKDYPDHI